MNRWARVFQAGNRLREQENIRCNTIRVNARLILRTRAKRRTAKRVANKERIYSLLSLDELTGKTIENYGRDGVKRGEILSSDIQYRNSTCRDKIKNGYRKAYSQGIWLAK